jgi:activator of HSP90 ATPase
MGMNLKQTATFNASPHAVYEILMDEKQHSTFTGGIAKISREVGGDFSIYDGDIQGKNIELIPDKKIVQSWRYNDWPVGHYSTVTFLLEPSVKGTKLTFTQTDIPDFKFEDIKQGWKDYYWQPIKAMLENQ